MSEDKTIKNFSAADIEKYWNNKLNPSEMHEMEKAAMDDPFLADALEGYKYSANTGEELRMLRANFDSKVNAIAPIIPIQRKKYAWLKIAAAIIVLIGAGLVVQQLVLKNKAEAPIVNVEKANENKPNEVAKTNEVAVNVLTDTAKTGAVSAQSATPKTEKKAVSVSDLNTSYALSAIDSLKADDRSADLVYKTKEAAQSTIAPAKVESQKQKALDEKTDVAGVSRPVADTTLYNFSKEESVAKKRANNQGLARVGALNNSYNYRVVDAQNNPVPFANVMNTRDKVGTYTDIKGYFNLVSSDSVLDVQVRSLGFNSENYRLLPSKQPNNLILKEDATARNQMNYEQPGRVMSNVSRKDSAEVEEPEVGWGNYNTYVENNIKIPDNVRAKNALNEVELSFDVDKSGQPINIKVTRSSQCKECDEEAKRLLKEGPKWKRKGRKYKTTISIAVDQN